jgi:deoxyribose-phosphate aldolase
VIIETGLLTDEEKARAVDVIFEAGGDYVKTCTGFLGSVATLHDVRLLYRASRGRLRVKASGGIRHALDALALVAAGASRLGTSSGDVIIEEYINLRGEER